jgi:UPF0755 protein
MARKLVAVVVALVVGAVLAALWWARRPTSPTPGSAVALGWPAGLAAEEAAELLFDSGLTESPMSLALYFRLTGASRCFRAGAHLLPRGLSPRELRTLLCDEPNRPRVKLTIPEGFTRYSIAERLEQLGIASRESFLTVTAEPEMLRSVGVEPGADAAVDTAEGYLFPATYDFARDSEPTQVMRRLVRELDRRFTKLCGRHPERVARLQADLGFGRREILTLASMVERETRAAEERGLVARVFLNRLTDPSFEPRLLQSDPTAAYGCLALGRQVPACRGFDGTPTPAVNHDPANRYSTYVSPELPPGPIANPGEAAIAAVLDPPEAAFLYFVARGDGRHTFSESLADHQRAVGELRRRRGP